MYQWLSLAIGIVGIASTFFAWKFNPRRAMYSELDGIYRKLEILYAQRDEALVNNDTDNLTLVVASITKLLFRKSEIFQRIRADSL